jgi:hypothetical protein
LHDADDGKYSRDDYRAAAQLGATWPNSNPPTVTNPQRARREQREQTPIHTRRRKRSAPTTSDSKRSECAPAVADPQHQCGQHQPRSEQCAAARESSPIAEHKPGKKPHTVNTSVMKMVNLQPFISPCSRQKLSCDKISTA